MRNYITSMAVGRYRDVITKQDGAEVAYPWGHNQAQDTQGTLTAGLYAGKLQPVSYMAYGEGAASWDITSPTLDPTDTTLLNELGRVAIVPGRFTYIDPDTLLPTSDPTRAIEITVEIGLGTTATLREFALFGGPATELVDSGIMVNWVSHNKIEKTEFDLVTRTIQLKWLTAAEAAALCP